MIETQFEESVTTFPHSGNDFPFVIFIYLFIYLTLPMNKQHITFTNIDNWQGTRYSLRQLQRPSI